MKSKKRITVFICIFFFCLLLYLWSETTIFYSQPSIIPIGASSRVQTEYFSPIYPNETHIDISFHGWEPIQFTITDMKFLINNAPSISDVSIQIECKNLTKNVDFWDYIVGGLGMWNVTRLNEYEKANQPDLRIDCPCFVNGSYLSWI